MKKQKIQRKKTSTFAVKQAHMKYYLIAGEASGDLHGSNLMKSILKADADAQFRFFGGDLMAAAGGTMVKHYRQLAYMGIWPVLTHLGTILKSAGLCFEDIKSWNPDAVILIDYPGFNLNIAKLVKTRLSIPVYYYISPKIWAWKSYRIRSMRQYVDELFSILPFETQWFADRDYRIRYVGNPSVDSVQEFKSADNSHALTETYSDKPVIALLAGSRQTEIRRNLPIMIDATRGLEDFNLVLAAAPGIDASFYDSLIKGSNVSVVNGNTYGLLSIAHAALVTSGTATLETALFNVPQVVCYRMPMGHVTNFLRRLVLKIPFISLVNLIAGKEVVPELVASQMDARTANSHLLPLLSDTPERQAQLDGYRQMQETLGPAGASQNAASQIVELLKQRQQSSLRAPNRE